MRTVFENIRLSVKTQKNALPAGKTIFGSLKIANDMSNARFREEPYPFETILRKSIRLKHGNGFNVSFNPEKNAYRITIGTALRGNRILSCTYQKFSDSEPYECTLSPYALKAYEGRWYLLARKNDEREFKHFSLDRIQRLELTEKTFQPVSFNAREFYAPFFGAFCDQKLKPQSILIRTDEQNAHYFRTLPLHHSQQELEPEGDTYRFRLHMCVTRDFEMEMRKYENTTWSEE